MTTPVPHSGTSVEEASKANLRAKVLSKGKHPAMEYLSKDKTATLRPVKELLVPSCKKRK